MNNLVERYIEKADDFREYLNEGEIYNKELTLSQAEWMLKKAAEEKQKNPMWDYIFKDDLKIKVPVNFEVPFTKIYYNDVEVKHGEVSVIDSYNKTCHKVFSALQSLIAKAAQEMEDNLYDIPNHYEDFENFDRRDINAAIDALKQFFFRFNKLMLNYHLPELDKAYRQGLDIVEFSFHPTNSMYASHYYPVYYTREELKTMMLMLLENQNVLYNTTEPIDDKEKGMFVYKRASRYRDNYYEHLYDFFKENTTFCKRIAKLPKRVKPARCVRKLMDKLKVEQEVYDNFEVIQSYFSLLKQYTHLDGTLVLSLDPMDFISASDNTYNWQSCFSIMKEGGYNRGCYAALTAPDICIAYIEGSTPFVFGKEKDRECSNKKWRAWVSINEDYFFVNKGYPFKSEQLTDIIESKIFSLTPQAWLDARKFKVEPSVEFSSMYSDFIDNTVIYFNSESIDKFPTFKTRKNEVAHELNIRLGGKTFDPFLQESFSYGYDECNGNMWGAPESYGMAMCANCGEYFSFDELYEDTYGDLYCEDCRCEYFQEEDEECEDDE